MAEGNNNVENDDEDLGLIDDTLDSQSLEDQKQALQENKAKAEASVQRMKDVGNFVQKSTGVDIFSPLKKGYKKILEFVSKHMIPALGTIISAVLIIVITIGLIAFIINLPGLLRGKIDDIISKISEETKTFLYGENAKLSGEAIGAEERKQLLNYISSDLGLDVIGFGFVPTATYKTGTDDKGENYDGKQIIEDYDSQIGFVSGEQSEAEKKSSNPDADLMYYYIMANERAYTLNKEGVWSAIQGIWRRWKCMAWNAKYSRRC